MRFLTWCLIGCVASLYEMLFLPSGSQALRHSLNIIYSKNEEYVRHYIEGGSIIGACHDSMTLQPFLTVNGQRVTNQVAGIEINQTVRDFDYRITFSRSTTLGEYKCQAGNDSILLFQLGYILCDPSQIAPRKVCGKGQFCVINGSSTGCQSQLPCEHIDTLVNECENGHPLTNIRGSCSGYNNAKSIPKGYYIGTMCGFDPHLLYKGQEVQYRSAIPVRASSGLDAGEWKLRSGGTRCYTRAGSDKSGKRHRFDPSSSATISQLESLPVKKWIVCDEGTGWIEFYILFYEKDVRFNIMQKKTNTTIDVTNRMEPLWLDPPPPFQCTVSVPGGLFVEAARTEVNSPTKPKLAEDSIELGDQKDISAPYTCWGYVYLYEPMGDRRFKELYREKREIVVRYPTTCNESRTTLAEAATVTKGWSPAQIGVSVGLSVLVVALLIAVIVFGVLWYRGTIRLKEVEERKSSSIVPVDASGEAVSISTSVAESED